MSLSEFQDLIDETTDAVQDKIDEEAEDLNEFTDAVQEGDVGEFYQNAIEETIADQFGFIDSGSDGSSGDTGDSGSDGSSGDTGDSGSDGSSGDTGDSGGTGSNNQGIKPVTVLLVGLAGYVLYKELGD